MHSMFLLHSSSTRELVGNSDYVSQQVAQIKRNDKHFTKDESAKQSHTHSDEQRITYPIDGKDSKIVESDKQEISGESKHIKDQLEYDLASELTDRPSEFTNEIETASEQDMFEKLIPEMLESLPSDKYGFFGPPVIMNPTQDNAILPLRDIIDVLSTDIEQKIHAFFQQDSKHQTESDKGRSVDYIDALPTNVNRADKISEFQTTTSKNNRTEPAIDSEKVEDIVEDIVEDQLKEEDNVIQTPPASSDQQRIEDNTQQEFATIIGSIDEQRTENQRQGVPENYKFNEDISTTKLINALRKENTELQEWLDEISKESSHTGVKPNTPEQSSRSVSKQTQSVSPPRRNKRSTENDVDTFLNENTLFNLKEIRSNVGNELGENTHQENQNYIPPLVKDVSDLPSEYSPETNQNDQQKLSAMRRVLSLIAQRVKAQELKDSQSNIKNIDTLTFPVVKSHSLFDNVRRALNKEPTIPGVFTYRKMNDYSDNYFKIKFISDPWAMKDAKIGDVVADSSLLNLPSGAGSTRALSQLLFSEKHFKHPEMPTRMLNDIFDFRATPDFKTDSTRDDVTDVILQRYNPTREQMLIPLDAVNHGGDLQPIANEQRLDEHLYIK